MNTIFLSDSSAFSYCLGLNNVLVTDVPIIEGEKYYVVIDTLSENNSSFLHNIKALGYVSYDINDALNKIIGWIELKINNDEAKDTYVISNYGLYSSPLKTTSEQVSDYSYMKMKYVAPYIFKNELIVSYGLFVKDSLKNIMLYVDFCCNKDEIDNLINGGLLDSESIVAKAGDSINTYSAMPIRKLNDNICENESCVISYENGLYDVHLVITGKALC